MRDHLIISNEGIGAKMKKYDVRSTYMQYFRAKKKAEEEIQGNFNDSCSS